MKRILIGAALCLMGALVAHAPALAQGSVDTSVGGTGSSISDTTHLRGEKTRTRRHYRRRTRARTHKKTAATKTFNPVHQPAQRGPRGTSMVDRSMAFAGGAAAENQGAEATSGERPMPMGPDGVLLVDLNTASRMQLLALPGVDAATVERIAGARPFTNISELISRGLISQELYASILPRITVETNP